MLPSLTRDDDILRSLGFKALIVDGQDPDFILAAFALVCHAERAMNDVLYKACERYNIPADVLVLP